MSKKQKDSNLINNKTFVKKLKYQPTKEDKVLVELVEARKELDELDLKLDTVKFTVETEAGAINERLYKLEALVNSLMVLAGVTFLFSVTAVILLLVK